MKYCDFEEKVGKVPSLNIKCRNTRGSPFRRRLQRRCVGRCANGRYGDATVFSYRAHFIKPTEDYPEGRCDYQSWRWSDVPGMNDMEDVAKMICAQPETPVLA